MNPYKLKSFRERLFSAMYIYQHQYDVDPYRVLEEM